MTPYQLLLALMALAVPSHAIMWSHQPNALKCLKEDLNTNVLITGDYDVEDAPGQKIDYVVSIPISIDTLIQLLTTRLCDRMTWHAFLWLQILYTSTFLINRFQKYDCFSTVTRRPKTLKIQLFLTVNVPCTSNRSEKRML